MCPNVVVNSELLLVALQHLRLRNPSQMDVGIGQGAQSSAEVV